MKTFLIEVALFIAVFLGGVFVGVNHAQVSSLKADAKATNEAAQVTAQGVVKAQVASVKVEEKIAAQNVNIAKNQSAIHTRVVKQIQQHIAAESNPSEFHDATPQDPVCGHYFLDVGTVRMLNATRQGAAIHTASSSDEEGDTAPALCYSEFVDADIDLTRLYLDLAVRHDALVDSVEGFQAEQRARLGVTSGSAFSVSRE
jgi:hypothetical protein